jgi:flagellar motor switch protein FliM
MDDPTPPTDPGEIPSPNEGEKLIAPGEALPEPKAGDGLSQAEVEQIVAQVQAEEAAATVLKPGGAKTRLGHEAIQPFDFRQPAFLTTSELRRLRLRHEEFIRALAAHLSSYLRMDVSMQMLKLQTLSYEKYTSSLASPIHLTLFKVEPLKGICLLDLSPRLGLTIIDRLLGGPAQSVTVSPELSEIDMALMDQVSQLILNEWCQLWQKVENARPVLLGHENSGRYLNSSPHDTVMLVLSMEVGLGDCVEQMQLAFPFLTIEPLVRQPELGADTAAGPGAAQPEQPRWNPGLDEVCVKLNTEWHGLEVSARHLASLKLGDLLLLDPSCFDAVEVRLEQIPKFHGRLGTSGTHWAVELTDVAKP